MFPGWLRAIADNLPLSHLNAAMRQVTSEGAGLTDVLPSILILCLWGAIAYVGAAKTFKWQ